MNKELIPKIASDLLTMAVILNSTRLLKRKQKNTYDIKGLSEENYKKLTGYLIGKGFAVIKTEDKIMVEKL